MGIRTASPSLGESIDSWHSSDHACRFVQQEAGHSISRWHKQRPAVFAVTCPKPPLGRRHKNDLKTAKALAASNQQVLDRSLRSQPRCIGFEHPPGARSCADAITLTRTPQFGEQQQPGGSGRAHIKVLYPLATYVGLADGAKANWDHLERLERHTTVQVFHFYLLCAEYIAQAALAAHPRDEAQRELWTEIHCHYLKHKHGAVTRLLEELEALRSPN
jgi:hypothetical protein